MVSASQIWKKFEAEVGSQNEEDDLAWREAGMVKLSELNCPNDPIRTVRMILFE